MNHSSSHPNKSVVSPTKEPPPVAATAAVAVASVPASHNNNNNNNNNNIDDDDDSLRSAIRKLQALEQLTELYGFDRTAASEAVEAVWDNHHCHRDEEDEDECKNDNNGTDDSADRNTTTIRKMIDACIQFLLDQGQLDAGGPVTPMDTCPHVARHVKLSIEQLPLRPHETVCSYPCAELGKQTNTTSTTTSTFAAAPPPPPPPSSSSSSSSFFKSDLTTDGTCPSTENWLCLECGVIRCSRYVNGHALAHWQATQQTQPPPSTPNYTNNHNDKNEEGHCIQVSLADLSVWCHVCAAYIRHSERLSPLTKQLEMYKFGNKDDDDDDGGNNTTRNNTTNNTTTVPMEEEQEEGTTMMTMIMNDQEMTDRRDAPRLPDRKKARSSEHLYEDMQLAMATTTTNTTTKASALSGQPSLEQQQEKEESNDEEEQGGGEYDKHEEGEHEGEHEDEEQEDDDDGDHDGDESNPDDAPSLPRSDARVNDEEQEEELIQVIRAAAAARGIPFEWLIRAAQSHDDNDEEEEEDEEEEVNYPFAQLPTSLKDVADFILSEHCQNILILAGAGMSVASGIPDFRSADGLYATMKPELLTADDAQREAIRRDPTLALDHTLFVQNPLPCLELNREFILGTRDRRWRATLAHRFVELLHAKMGKLVRLYTQNIDGLEGDCAQLPRDKVIAVHGSMDQAECATCKTESDFTVFAQRVQQQIKDLSGTDPSAPSVSTPIVCETCGSNTMKPAIVLFRSSLPEAFFHNVPRDVKDIDLFLVMGTSLRVAPANSLVWRIPRSALRVLVNREEVGIHLGMDFDPETSKRDYFAKGDCDTVLLELMDHLGWLDDLAPLLSGSQLPDSSSRLLDEYLQCRATTPPGSISGVAGGTEDVFVGDREGM